MTKEENINSQRQAKVHIIVTTSKGRETIKDINWFDILSLFFKEVDQRRKFTEDGSIDVGEGGEIVKFQIRGRTTERRKR